jgi:DNA-binding NtrC family response regulator
MNQGTLLSIVEIGGYANFIPLYQRLGYQVHTLNSMRKALSWLKRNCPEVVVAEFNFDPTFRDRVSNLESLLASLQRYRCDARVILFLEPQRRAQLDQVLERYSVDAVIEFPIEPERLAQALARS